MTCIHGKPMVSTCDKCDEGVQGRLERPTCHKCESLHAVNNELATRLEVAEGQLREALEEVERLAEMLAMAATKEMTSGLVKEYVREVHIRAEKAEAECESKDKTIASMREALEDLKTTDDKGICDSGYSASYLAKQALQEVK